MFLTRRNFEQLAILVVLSPHVLQVAKGQVEDLLPSHHFTVPLDGNAQVTTGPAAVAGLSTCPSGSKFATVCIDSAMDSILSGDIPPDPHGAAGTNSLIAVVNTQIEGLRKDGTTVFAPTNLSSMFSSLSPKLLFDPKIRFDVQQGRFVVVVLDATVSNTSNITDSNILVAVSKTGDPASATTADWNLLKIPSLVNDTFADYPGLAVDEEAIYITVNMFTTKTLKFQKGLLWIIAKDPFYSGGTPVFKMHDYLKKAGGGVIGFRGVHMPAMVRSTTGIAPNVGTYLVKYDGVTMSGSESIQVIQINDPLGANTTFKGGLVSIGNVDAAGEDVPGAPQPDISTKIDTGDRRALDAVWVNNTLWMVATVVDSSGETAALWVKFTANGVKFPPTLSDKGRITGETIERRAFTYYPSIDANSKAVVAIGFSASSADNIFASAYATIRDDKKDKKENFRTPDLVKKGVATYVKKDADGRNRWGDYSSTALDPSDNDCFWVFNAYVGAKDQWNTAWGKLCYYGNTTSPTKPTRKPKPPKGPTNTTRKPNKKPNGGGGKCLKENKSCQPRTRCCSPLVCRQVKVTLLSFAYKCAHCVELKGVCIENTDCCSGSCEQKTKKCR